MSRDPLVEVENLEKHYPITEGLLKKQVGTVRAVDGVSFDIGRGETVGLVGESGCGKSTAATSMLRLEEPTGGTVRFDGEDITEYDDAALKRFRRRAQMIFQDPSSSFDPRMSIGESVAEPLRIHGLNDRTRRRAVVEDLLERVGLSASDADRYPHEFSGGQKQRVAVARALSVNPDFILADEPVSALDVSIQADVLSLLDDVQSEFGLSFLLISHDMGVVRQVCDRVNVMYLGEIVESGPTEEVFGNPQHPYTKALLSSIPRPDPRKRGRGIELTGDVPDPSNPPDGCRFHTRCPAVIPPEGLAVAQETWRSLLDLRSRAARGDLDPGALADAADEPSPTPALVREAFDLPDPLPDGEAEATLAAALETAADGDVAAAGERLVEAFPTPCAKQAPERRQVSPDHEATCHLHDPDLAPDHGDAYGIGVAEND